MCSSPTGTGKEHYVPIFPSLGVSGETGLGLASCRTWLCCSGLLALWRSLLQARGKLSASCSALKLHKHKGSRTGCGSRMAATICQGIFTTPSWLPSVHEGKRFIQPVSLTSILNPAEQTGGISGLVGVKGKHRNRKGIVPTGGCGDTTVMMWHHGLVPKGSMHISYMSPSLHKMCHPTTTPSPLMASQAGRRLERPHFGSPLFVPGSHSPTHPHTHGSCLGLSHTGCLTHSQVLT